MSKADSLSVFTEGTFEQQVQELVNYLARGLSDSERSEFIRPFQDALITPEDDPPIGEDQARMQKVISLVLGAVKGLGEGSDREIEGFFNMLYAHTVSLFTDSTALREQLAPLLHTIAAAEDHTNVKYKILSNLFNALPRRSPLRLLLYNALLDLALSQDDIGTLQTNLAEINRWLSEWDISPDEKSAFLESLSNAYAKADHLETSYDYYLAYVASLPSSSPSTTEASLKAISKAISTPSILNFDSLLRVENLKTVKDHPLFALLRIFVTGVLAEYQKWVASNADAIQKFDLPTSLLERKIRLLSLSSLATKYIGGDLSYAEIASALQIDQGAVETWVIDVIRAGLISGKLAQPTQTLHITRASHRSFEPADWKELEKRLIAWKTELVTVLEVLANAKSKNTTTTKTKPQSPDTSTSQATDKGIANTV